MVARAHPKEGGIPQGILPWIAEARKSRQERRDGVTRQVTGTSTRTLLMATLVGPRWRLT